MAWMSEAPSLSALFSTYASVMASIMFLRSMVNEFLPQSLRAYLESTFHYLFKSKSLDLTLVFEESTGMGTNQVFKAAECYLSTKISPDTEKLKVSKISKEKDLTIQLEKGETVVDTFEGVELKWTFMGADEKQKEHDPDPISSYELCFLKKHKELVLNSYVPFVLDRYKDIKNSKRVLKMHSLSNSLKGGSAWWESIVLEHPSTFDTLAMTPHLKNGVMEDLDRFVRRKEFYKRVGRAWKRGYLLYGPPGTGKSSLVAAMANYLKFDVYDLQLANIMHDSDLRKLLLATANRSILVIEDIDCSVGLPNRLTDDSKNEPERKTQLTLSGLLNFIDGLWSSCGDERIIIFTTNHKEKLDPALLRPGRMDMHIHMSYCTFDSFKLLASNYLGTSEDHPLYEEVRDLLNTTEVTPAQVAEEFMKSEDPGVALRDLINLLKETKMKKEPECNGEEQMELET